MSSDTRFADFEIQSFTFDESGRLSIVMYNPVSVDLRVLREEGYSPPREKKHVEA